MIFDIDLNNDWLLQLTAGEEGVELYGADRDFIVWLARLS
jgi:hypothetical protein